MNLSTATARSLVSSLISSGVRDVVVAPGSRSAPLTYAIAEAAAAGSVEARVRIDERDAAFFALGIAKGLRAAGRERPVAVVTTSGSAVANLHPAVLEASYGFLPLLAITADRPARMRGTGANQTIDNQAQVLSDLRAQVDVPVGDDAPGLVAEASRTAVSTALGDGFASRHRPGPVQLNVQFDMPLVPEPEDTAPWWPIASGPVAEVLAPVPLARGFARTVLRAFAGNAVVLAGDTFGLPAERLGGLLRRFRVPVLAEPSSPLVHSPDLVVDHTQVLGARPDLVDRVADLIVLGKPTLSRPDQRLLASVARVHRVQPDLDQVADEEWAAALREARVCLHDDARDHGPGAEQTDWTAEWVTAGRKHRRGTVPEPPSGTRPGDRRVDARAAAAAVIGPPGTVFAGSSNAIRYLDEVLIPEAEAEIFASRGLAGIDGLVSTAIGFASGSRRLVRLLIGDVSLLHDIGGLLRESGEAPPQVQIYVLNDDGGAIFGGLEHGRRHLAPYFPRFFATEHGRTFGDFARGYGWHHELCTSVSAIEDAVISGRPGVYEIPLAPVVERSGEEEK